MTDCCFVDPKVPCNSVSMTLNASMRDGLSQQTQVLSNETMKSFDTCTNRRVDLVEICASWDSPLSDEVERKGGTGLPLD